MLIPHPVYVHVISYKMLVYSTEMLVVDTINKLGTKASQGEVGHFVLVQS